MNVTDNIAKAQSSEEIKKKKVWCIKSRKKQKTHDSDSRHRSDVFRLGKINIAWTFQSERCDIVSKLLNSCSKGSSFSWQQIGFESVWQQPIALQQLWGKGALGSEDQQTDNRWCFGLSDRDVKTLLLSTKNRRLHAKHSVHFFITLTVLVCLKNWNDIKFDDGFIMA